MILLSRYGKDFELFSFQAGKLAAPNDGVFYLRTPKADDLFTIIDWYVASRNDLPLIRNVAVYQEDIIYSKG